MKINKYHGIFFDTVFYMLVHFYRDTLIERVFHLSEDLERDLRFHDAVSKFLQEKKIIIPDDIKMLFYTNIDKAAFLINFYRDKVKYTEAEYVEYYNVFTNKELIKKEFFEYYLAVEGDDLKTLIECKNFKKINQIIKSSDLPNEVKPDFYMFSVAADENIDLFIETYKMLLPIIEELHEKNSDLYYKIINQLNDPNTYTKLIKSFKKEEDKPLILSFSLMNPIGIFYNKNIAFNYFRLGESFVVNFNVLNNKSNFYSIMRVLGTNQRQNIFDLFLEYEKLSKNDIAKILKTSYHAIQNYIEIFKLEKIIYISEKKSNKYYYSINKKYFGNYKNLVNDFHDKVILKDYGKKEYYDG